MCPTQEGKVNYFRIPHTCTSTISLTYSLTAVRPLTSSLSSVLTLMSISTFVIPTSSSFLYSLLCQIISKYINQWHWYRLPIFPEYSFQQFEFPPYPLLILVFGASCLWAKAPWKQKNRSQTAENFLAHPHTILHSRDTGTLKPTLWSSYCPSSLWNICTTKASPTLRPENSLL